MKKTLTVDDGVIAALEHLRRDRNVTLEEIVNDTLRCGLRDMKAEPNHASHFELCRWIAGHR